MQVINTIRSWDKRTEVFEYLVPLLDQDNTLYNVFVEVPYFLNSNYNNEPVFSLIDDFQGGLLLNGYNGQVEQVFPFTSRMIRDSSYWPNHNILNVIRTKKIDHFSCLSSAKTSPYSCDSIVYYNDDIDSFLASNYFANKIECERSALRSWLSKIFK
jgi:hypothetical protein